MFFFMGNAGFISSTVADRFGVDIHSPGSTRPSSAPGPRRAQRCLSLPAPSVLLTGVEQEKGSFKVFGGF